MRYPTDNEVKVLKILSSEPNGLIGLHLSEKTDIRRGSVYYILERMEIEDWLRVRVLQPPSRCGGYPRKLYFINEKGKQVLDHVMRYQHG